MKKLLVLVAVLVLLAVLSSACAEDPFANMKTYSEGQYKIGFDMPAGEYVLLSTRNSGYFAITSDSNGRDIIANDNFTTNSIVTVNYGEYLELSRCIAVESSDFYSEYSIKTENYGTMLKVGYDVRPGEYKIVAEEGKSGYYCIYNDSRHQIIVSNDNFKNSRYITLSYGQYVILSRCRIQ